MMPPLIPGALHFGAVWAALSTVVNLSLNAAEKWGSVQPFAKKLLLIAEPAKSIVDSWIDKLARQAKRTGPVFG